ncbi:tetratricopeptide repeat protein [Streptomyces sp. MUM 178J]|uniref:tetratricopeptide repeat protein n=1 Tax=Streptomyces sp. MUM 178J TaxID=2791991 RepID=UPI001F038D83|nr:tetratricopeptide repeat protein [Streptomyces sp. MUM 178J]WRQ80751.1 glycosyltransferase [Streptomyces sp. MUM 178J]
MSDTRTPPRIVGCVIAKDEERFLADSLRSMRQICDELILVDTGSHDSTRAIGEQLADQVADFPFSGDFSEARNHALSLVGDADWVFFLDADERLHTGQVEPLREAIETAGPQVGGITLLRYNFFPTGGFYTGRELKVFRSRPQIRYERKINESVKPALARDNWGIVHSSALLTHIGHARPRSERDAKAIRYMSLMHEQLADQPDDAVLTGYIGLNLRLFGRFDEAVQWSEKALGIDGTNPTVWAFHGHVLRAAGKAEEARQAYEKGLSLRPGDASLKNMVGVCQTADGDLDAADRTFAEVIETEPTLLHAVINRGVVAQARGDYAQAEAFFLDAARRFPPFLTEDAVGRLEVDPLHPLYFETVTGYAGLAHHLAFARGCREGWLIPERIDCRAAV